MLTSMFHAACRSVLASNVDDYAKAYAQHGLTLTTEKAIKQQAFYLLSNLTSWRGDVAAITRGTLRAIVHV